VKRYVLLSLSLVLLFLGCGTFYSSRVDSTIGPDNKNSDQLNIPLKVAVLPFNNLTDENGLELLVRESFYNHLSSKVFQDIEIKDIDRAISEIEKREGKKWKDIPPDRLGRLLGADIVVSGSILNFKKFFLGIYSQISLTLHVQIINTYNGDILWMRTLTNRSHDGGIPFSLFGIVPSALRSTLHLTNERKMDLIEKICRNMVSIIPFEKIYNSICVYYDIQVAAFLDKDLCIKTIDRLKRLGYEVRVEKRYKRGRLWHTILIGPFSDEKTAKRIIERIKKDTEFIPILVFASH